MLHQPDERLLHFEFIKYLDDIDLLARFSEGYLRSRQVIALAIVTWQRINPDKKIVGD